MENQIDNACLTQAWNKHSLNLKVTLFSGSRKQIATRLEKSLSTCCHSDQSHRHSENGASSLWCCGFLMELGQWKRYSTVPSCIDTLNMVPALFGVVDFWWNWDSGSATAPCQVASTLSIWCLLSSALWVFGGKLIATASCLVASAPWREKNGAWCFQHHKFWMDHCVTPTLKWCLLCVID